MDELAKSYMQQCIEGLVLIGKLRDLNEEMYSSLQELLHYARNCGADPEMLDRASAVLAKARP